MRSGLTSFTHIPSKVRFHQLIVVHSGNDYNIRDRRAIDGGREGHPAAPGTKLGGPRCGRRRVWRSTPLPRTTARILLPWAFYRRPRSSPCASRHGWNWSPRKQDQDGPLGSAMTRSTHSKQRANINYSQISLVGTVNNNKNIFHLFYLFFVRKRSLLPI